MSARRPLIAFVHIPKTAGNSVYHHLETTRGPGIAYIERARGDDNLAARIGKVNWVGGHLSISDLKALLPNPAEVSFFTVLREPTSQVASYLGWMFTVASKGSEVYTREPKWWQRMMFDVVETDFTEPQCVANTLLKYKHVFLNCQARQVVVERSGNIENDVSRALANFAFIGTIDNLAALMEDVSGVRLEAARRNVSPSRHFDPGVLESAVVQRVLVEHNAVDELLYETVMDRSRRSTPASTS
jgi:hypothetical protein